MCLWQGVSGLIVSLFIFQPAAFAQGDPVKDALTAELGFIKRVFETGYAPAQWKKSHFGWDLNTEFGKALNQVSAKSTISAADYRQIIAGLLTSTHDYHVGFQFFSTEVSRLPFLVNGAQGHFYIVYIDETKLNKTVFPFQVGDEVVSFGGQPIADVINDLKAKVSWGVDSTDSRLAERLLTTRPAAMTLAVPNGQLMVVAKRGGLTISRELTWDYTPEAIDWNPLQAPRFSTMADSAKAPAAFKSPEMAWGMFETWNKSVDTTVSPFQIGGRKSWVPVLGSVLWQSAESDIFHAYIYRNDQGKLIGYVRIPAYAGQEGKAFLEFKSLMQRFEGVTDALVIDEVNNPGGSVFYVLALMSVLSSDPIKVPDHAITLWPNMIADNEALIQKLLNVKNDDETRQALGVEQMDGFPVTYTMGQATLAYARQVSAAWKQGKRITEPLFLYGVDKVNPDNQVNYSKPIVVLINELDFSGGDFFPAILQDNKRAKMFGQRTAGAGGYILGVEFPSSLGLKRFSFTGSIARRVNNDPIENLGVAPDIPYPLSAHDLQAGFVDYKAALNAALTQEINAH